jgi:hypothetical protein
MHWNLFIIDSVPVFHAHSPSINQAAIIGGKGKDDKEIYESKAFPAD